MAEGWRDNDERIGLMGAVDGTVDEIPVQPPPPTRRQRVFAISLLGLVLLPLFALLWLAAIQNPDPHLEHPPKPPPPTDSFVLDRTFDLGAPPTTRVFRWNVSEIALPGNRTRKVVNGRSPGPLIEANVHDRILVYLTNNLTKDGTAIHWHGLPQPLTPFYDGTPGITQCPIPPGQTLLYNFTFGGWTGTTWWHGHTSVQHTDGLFGPLVVHSPLEAAAPVNATSKRQEDPRLYAAEHVLTMSDVYSADGEEMKMKYLTENPMETIPEPVPDWAEINGLGGGSHSEEDSVEGRMYNDGRYAELRAQSGVNTRLRLINAGSFAPLRIFVDGHALEVIEADGTPLAAPYQRYRDILIHPAQRYSVLVTREDGDERTAFWVRAKMEDGAFAYENLRMQPEARAVLRYDSSVSNTSLPLPTTRGGPPPSINSSTWWDALPHFEEWDLRPAASVSPPPNNDIVVLPFKFSIQRTHDQNWRSFINGTAWEVPAAGDAALVKDLAGMFGAGLEVQEGVRTWPLDQMIAVFKHGRTVDVVITNLDDSEHPFHLHGYALWLLGHGRGRFKAAKAELNAVDPMRRDTFLVPRRGWAVVRFVADNPGYWAFHCHIAWHMVGGGLFQVAVASPLGSMGVVLPDDLVSQCGMW
ncbi:multi-copper oxidase [Roridomyces roridus]|uniref:Multi-copper oxidase n=1 Tax=Roridomyces roridus TaxID=1738132 RepID=A0AAD7BPQ5_9AGAR|nr:multi-copper oxidase [Roridomyces roridus]